MDLGREHFEHRRKRREERTRLETIIDQLNLSTDFWIFAIDTTRVNRRREPVVGDDASRSRQSNRERGRTWKRRRDRCRHARRLSDLRYQLIRSHFTMFKINKQRSRIEWIVWLQEHARHRCCEHCSTLPPPTQPANFFYSVLFFPFSLMPNYRCSWWDSSQLSSPGPATLSPW
jgi:hypothetical protein